MFYSSVLEPNTKAVEPKLMGVPGMVIPEPGGSARPAIENPVGFGVTAWSPSVEAGSMESEGVEVDAIVLEPGTRSDEPK